MIEKGNEKNPLFTKCQIGSGTNVPECKYGNGNIKLIVIGDSHTEAMIPAIQNSPTTRVSSNRLDLFRLPNGRKYKEN